MAVLANVCITSMTLPDILLRSRDTHDSVRALAFRTVAEKVELRQLTIQQRVQLLHEGLRDRVTPVRAACMDLACTWLCSRAFNLTEVRCSRAKEAQQQVANWAVFC